MFAKHQPHHIHVKPIRFPKERIKRYKRKGGIEATAFEATEEQIVFDKTYVISTYKLFGIILLISGIYIIYPFNISGKDTFSVILIFMMLILGIALLIIGFKIKPKEKHLILDRKSSIITYPGPFLAKPLTGPFNSLKVIIAASGGDDMLHREYLNAVNTFSPKRVDVPVTISYDDPYEAWSFFVWYMDKNRPLPPGTAFDPYRQKDYERRKAARFPQPLYSSSIPTPESTPKQQAEREQFWTDGFGKMKFLPCAIEKNPANFNERVTIEKEPHDIEYVRLKEPYYRAITDSILEQHPIKLGVFRTKNTLKFNRLAGTLFYTSEISETVLETPFSTVKIGYCIDMQKNSHIVVYFETEEGPKHAMGMEFLKEHSFKGVNEEWSFYTWYMDKNRPLPPGTGFDAYRNADFERRKAAGFPPPLYSSQVPTHEATKAQQKEREKYWKDSD